MCELKNEILLNEEYELVRCILDRLPSHHKKIIKMKFGFDNYKIHEDVEIADFFNVDVNIIKAIIKDSLIKIKEELIIYNNKEITEEASDYLLFKSIYVIFKNYSKDVIDDIVNKLSIQDKKIINILEQAHFNNIKVHKKYIWKFYGDIKPKMTQLFLKYKKTNTMKTIYELLSDYSKEEIDEVIIDLSLKEKELIKLRYGSNLENPIKSEDWDMSLGNQFYSQLIPKMKQLLKK